ncbi:MAG: cation:proton antiporter subunit C [Candidatus Delongbacteria bacterium]|nr:cation:proton antiporter subunit C [Candidatus Delongbacteria bacterium]MCG2759984.1 cation:proton antiporter subunit C [Candidatus Delongbacteria bacterium]
MNIIHVIGFALMLIGIWGMLTQKNMIKIILGLAIAETGVQLVMVAFGFIKGRTAPILDAAVPVKDAVDMIVDPVPQALVLTAIVIGVAVNALMLTFVIKLYQKKRSLSITEYKDLKW